MSIPVIGAISLRQVFYQVDLVSHGPVITTILSQQWTRISSVQRRIAGISDIHKAQGSKGRALLLRLFPLHAYLLQQLAVFIYSLCMEQYDALCGFNDGALVLSISKMR
jgi:hypothetical protein